MCVDFHSSNPLLSLTSRYGRCSALDARRPLRVVHSALCTRVLINLRKAAVQPSGMRLDDFTQHTTLAFDHGTTGTLPEDEELPELDDMGYYD